MNIITDREIVVTVIPIIKRQRQDKDIVRRNRKRLRRVVERQKGTEGKVKPYKGKLKGLKRRHLGIIVFTIV